MDGINEIFNTKQEMLILNIISIGLATFSMVMIIVFGVLYCKKRKTKRLDAIESLMEGQSTTLTV